MKNRADEVIYLMRSHSGYGYRNVPAKVLQMFVRYEWESNRWGMIVEKGTDKILGWISWYSLDSESLMNVRKYGLPGCYSKDIPIHPGNCLYICNVIVREDSPANVFRTLWNMALEANPDACTVNAHLYNRNAHKPRWFTKYIADKKTVPHRRKTA